MEETGDEELDEILLEEARLEDEDTGAGEEALLEDTGAGALDAALLEMTGLELTDDRTTEETATEEAARLLFTIDETDELELETLLELDDELLACFTGALVMRIQFRVKLPLVANTPK